jgi:hypothetical protein
MEVSGLPSAKPHLLGEVIMQKHRATMPTLLGLCVVASTVAATPASAALGPTGTVFDGDYTGVMNLTANAANGDGPNADLACVDARPATMTIRNGNAYLQYANWRGDLLHFRGTLNASGQVVLYHTKGDGSSSILPGQMDNNVLSGHMVSEPDCHYSVKLAKK